MRGVCEIAAQFYQQALLLNPGDGQIQNQLGTLAQVQADVPASLMRFALASAASHQFTHASSNALRVLATMRERLAAMTRQHSSLKSLISHNSYVPA